MKSRPKLLIIQEAATQLAWQAQLIGGESCVKLS